MSDMLEKLREWTAEAEKLEAANERFAQEVAEIEKAATQADAYRQVVNAQASISTRTNWTSIGRRRWTTSYMPMAEKRSMGGNPPISITLRRRKRCAPTEEPTR